MKVLGLIPARGGSKGIPNKNIKPLGGRPLLAWTIEAASNASHLNTIVVSTDDPDIARTAKEWGAEVPFIRPAELARDDTPGVDPAIHALEQLADFDAVLLLQPTSPLRTASDIDACISLAKSGGAASVVSVTLAHQHPSNMFLMGEGARLTRYDDSDQSARRQDRRPLHILNGALYFSSRQRLLEHRSFIDSETLAYVMPPERSVDIDNPLDWMLAEALLWPRVQQKP